MPVFSEGWETDEGINFTARLLLLGQTSSAQMWEAARCLLGWWNLLVSSCFCIFQSRNNLVVSLTCVCVSVELGSNRNSCIYCYISFSIFMGSIQISNPCALRVLIKSSFSEERRFPFCFSVQSESRYQSALPQAIWQDDGLLFSDQRVMI